ncbi:MAG: hypothetical protein ACC628_00935 [Pirellulaceae bacterium]
MCEELESFFVERLFVNPRDDFTDDPPQEKKRASPSGAELDEAKRDQVPNALIIGAKYTTVKCLDAEFSGAPPWRERREKGDAALF